MRVDPADSSYIPSHIVVKGGHSLNAVDKELRSINVEEKDCDIIILRDMQEVSACKVHVY